MNTLVVLFALALPQGALFPTPAPNGAVAKGLPVYFPVMNYCFGEGWRPGYGTYARRCHVSEAEAVRRLLDLAKRCGGAGVTLECVDFNNYSPAVRDELIRFRRENP